MGFFIPVWKEAPFIRLIIPLITGIIVAFYVPVAAIVSGVIICSCFAGMLLFSFFSLPLRFGYAFVYGILINGLIIAFGTLITTLSDTSLRATQVEQLSAVKPFFIAVLTEPVSARPKSFKALAVLSNIQKDSSCLDPQTNIILYFSKDNAVAPPVYGTRILFAKLPQRIKNMPATGSFDYVQYCALRNIYFQVFLKTGEYSILSGTKTDPLSQLLFSVRKWVVGILQKYIPGKKEYGLAEALLIGYKEDLDKQLIQSYSNTGVVHVVAISGLHLGLIYGLLKYFCRPLGKKAPGKWLSPLIIISGLWLFSLLAGGSPSVLRSAVMFSFLVAGELLSKKTSMFNNLAASAFFLLCYNPYWLWDVGFQLSYAALISIVVFMKPIYHQILLKNKLLDAVWKLNAVTLSAQLLTLPVCIYYFHQFPTLFLITNFIAVPLSSIILMGEIVLCLLSFIPLVAGPVGWCLTWLLKMMNASVELLGSFRFSLITGLEIGITQVLCLYIIICSIGVWLLQNKRSGLPLALIAAILFMAVRFV